MSGFICRKDGDYCEAHGGPPPGCSTAPSQACGMIGGFQSFGTINTSNRVVPNKNQSAPEENSVKTPKMFSF